MAISTKTLRDPRLFGVTFISHRRIAFTTAGHLVSTTVGNKLLRFDTDTFLISVESINLGAQPGVARMVGTAPVVLLSDGRLVRLASNANFTITAQWQVAPSLGFFGNHLIGGRINNGFWFRFGRAGVRTVQANTGIAGDTAEGIMENVVCGVDDGGSKIILLNNRGKACVVTCNTTTYRILSVETYTIPNLVDPVPFVVPQGNNVTCACQRSGRVIVWNWTTGAVVSDTGASPQADYVNARIPAATQPAASEFTNDSIPQPLPRAPFLLRSLLHPYPMPATDGLGGGAYSDTALLDMLLMQSQHGAVSREQRT